MLVTTFILSMALVQRATPSGNATSVRQAKPVCQNAGSLLVKPTQVIVRARPLNEEPPAKQVLTLFRTEGGCMKPVIVRENIGSQPQR